MKLFGIGQNIGGILKRGKCECGSTNMTIEKLNKYDHDTATVKCSMVVLKCNDCDAHYNGTGAKTEEYNNYKNEQKVVLIGQEGIKKAMQEVGIDEKLSEEALKKMYKHFIENI